MSFAAKVLSVEALVEIPLVESFVARRVRVCPDKYLDTQERNI